VLPELATTGAVFKNAAEAGTVAETTNGRTVKSLSSIAEKNKVSIVTSFVEQDGGKLYNTGLLLDGNGVVGKYRKLHLNHLDRRWATPGNLGLPTFDTKVGRIGLVVGYDGMFPEAFRCLAGDGADIICAPSAVEFPAPIASEGTTIPHPRPIPTGPDPLHWHLWRVRAGESCTYVAFANQFGTESGVNFIGRSGIFQPDLFAFPRKETVASENREEILTLEVDTRNLKSDQPTNPVRSKYLLRMRLPYWYDPVVMHPRKDTKSIALIPQRARSNIGS
jgi:predicted amidohydrolase